MSKLIELLRHKPKYVEHKEQSWWGPAERKNYRREYRSYAGDKALTNFVFATAAVVLLMSAQPRPAPIEIQLLSPGTATHQTETTRPVPSRTPELSPAATRSTIYDRAPSQQTTVWTNGTNK